jgi:hypothetical protein
LQEHPINLGQFAAKLISTESIFKYGWK